jgi:hypothetical protein
VVLACPPLHAARAAAPFGVDVPCASRHIAPSLWCAVARQVPLPPRLRVRSWSQPPCPRGQFGQ